MKTSPLGRAYPSFGEAQAVADGLQIYADELATQPLTVVPFYGAEVVQADSGYKVQHSYGYVEGPNLSRLEQGQLQPAMARLLGRVAGMDTIDGPNKLRVPFDAKSQNFVGSSDPTLIDIMPAISRRPDGSFPTEHFPGEPRRGGYVSWALGTKSGAMTMLLSTAINRGKTPTSKMGHILTEADDWAYDVLPDGLDPNVRAAVRRQIGMRFLPFMARGAVKKANNIRQRLVA